MKTIYIVFVSAASAGMAAYLSPSKPYWIAVTVPALIVLSIHYVTYIRKSLRLHRRMSDTLALTHGECPVCVMSELVSTDGGAACNGCGTIFVVDPADGFVDRRP